MELQLRESAAKRIATQMTVLLIDDNLDSLYLGRAILERDGFLVFTASSGAKALSLLEEIRKPNLILLDMQMADMSGQDFLEILDSRKPDFMTEVPVVFYSAVDQMSLGKAAGFIRKAGDMDHFLRQVRSYLELH